MSPELFYDVKEVLGTCYYLKRPDLIQDEVPEIKYCDFENKCKLVISNHDLCENKKLSEKMIASIIPSLPSIYDSEHPMHPMEIIKTIIICHEFGVYPPPWAMNELYIRLSDYTKEKREGSDKRLGEYFGEPSEGSNIKRFKKSAFANVMYEAMLDIDRFRIWFGLRRIDDAIDLVVQKLETFDNKTPFKFKKGFATLQKDYKIWSKDGHPKVLALYYKKHPPSRADKIEMLQGYPINAFDAHQAIFNEYLND